MSQTKCFLYGIGMGIAAGVLMAPRAGVKTRKQLVETAKEGQDYVMREGAELKDTIVDGLKRTKRAAQATAESIGVALQAGKERLVG